MYIILEMQTNGNTTAVVPPTTKEDYDEAQSVWHSILASAAISSVEKHTAMIIGEDGEVYENRCYYHSPPPPNAP